MKKNRPIEVGLLTLLLAWLSIWYGLRLIESLRFWDVAQIYLIQPGPLYLAVSGGIASLVAVLLTWAVWTGKRWSWSALLGASIGYAIWVWVDRFTLQNPHGNETFTAVGLIAGFILFFILLFSRHARDFSHDR
jgi:hypothetical protein